MLPLASSMLMIGFCGCEVGVTSGWKVTFMPGHVPRLGSALSIQQIPPGHQALTLVRLRARLHFGCGMASGFGMAVLLMFTPSQISPQPIAPFFCVGCG